MEFKVELDEFHESETEVFLSLGSLFLFVFEVIIIGIIGLEKEVGEQIDGFLKKGMVVNGKFTVDVSGGLVHENLLSVCTVML